LRDAGHSRNGRINPRSNFPLFPLLPKVPKLLLRGRDASPAHPYSNCCKPSSPNTAHFLSARPRHPFLHRLHYWMHTNCKPMSLMGADGQLRVTLCQITGKLMLVQQTTLFNCVPGPAHATKSSSQRSRNSAQHQECSVSRAGLPETTITDQRSVTSLICYMTSRFVCTCIAGLSYPSNLQISWADGPPGICSG